MRRLMVMSILVVVGCGETTNSVNPATNGSQPDASMGQEDAGEPLDTSAAEDLGGMQDSGDDAEPDTGSVDDTGSSPDTEEEPCVSDLDFFQDELWRPLFRDTCGSCHQPEGAAQSTLMVFETRQDTPETRLGNLQVMRQTSFYQWQDEPLILAKPLGLVDHGGGQILSPDSEIVEKVRGFVERMRAGEPTLCEDDLEEDADFFDEIVLMGPDETLRRSAMSIASRLPSQEEVATVKEHGWVGFEVALNQLLSDDGFYQRMGVVWNDILLTDAYLTQQNATRLLDPDYYPSRQWFQDQIPDTEDPNFVNQARQHTNDSLAREAINHILFVLRQNRPFTEILTADYIAVNPYTARLYEIEGLEWDDPTDPGEFQEGRSPGIPHAGILTSPVFLNRFPTSNTNNNRHRAGIVLKKFLNFDIFTLGARAIDPTSAFHNPTMNDPQCSICHVIIDPLAGSFQHWTAEGSYAYRSSWIENMRAPGFGDEIIPSQERDQSLRWLAHQITQDQRFAEAMANLAFETFTGHALQPRPVEGESNYETKLRIFSVQNLFISEVARNFIATRFDFKDLIKNIVRSPWFRAVGATEEARRRPQLELDAVGIGWLLTPEQLNKKIAVTTGFQWRSSASSPDHLVSPDSYALIYGGLDSIQTVDRYREPNALFAGVQLLMGNEVSCRVVGYEFWKLLNGSEQPRIVLPHVSSTDPLLREDDTLDPLVEQETRLGLQYLFWRMWGLEVELDDPELEEVFDFFLEIHQAGLDRGENQLNEGCYISFDLLGNRIEGIYSDSTYMVRAWQSTLFFFLIDHRFLIE